MEEITKKDRNIGMAIIAYIIFFLPLLTEEKNNPFVKYHVKQGFVLFLAGVVARIITRLPILGWFLVSFLNAFVFILFVIGVMNVLNGKKEPLPVIGKFADKFKF